MGNLAGNFVGNDVGNYAGKVLNNGCIGSVLNETNTDACMYNLNIYSRWYVVTLLYKDELVYNE